MITLTRPETVESNTVSDANFCHVVCSCRPKITLCGAYKPVQCGIMAVDTLSGEFCPRCNKAFCPDCDELIEVPCPNCLGA